MEDNVKISYAELSFVVHCLSEEGGTDSIKELIEFLDKNGELEAELVRRGGITQ